MGTLTIDNKKITTASSILDPKCTEVVQPFDLTNSFQKLVEITGTELGTTLQNVFRNGMPGQGLVDRNKTTLKESLSQAAKQMNWLPMSTEVMYGESMHEKMKDQVVDRDGSVGRKSYPVADRMLQQVLSGVGQTHEYDFRLYVRAQNGGNATALAGGIVYIDRDLLQDEQSQAKGYFALAHEISHVLQRHETRLLQARLIDTVSITGSLEDMVAMIRQPSDKGAAVIRTALAGKAVFGRHYSNQELQADACAVRILDQAWHDDRKLGRSIASFKTSLKLDSELRQQDAPEVPPSTRSDMTPTRIGRTSPGIVKDIPQLPTILDRPTDRHPTDSERIKRLDDMYREVRR